MNNELTFERYQALNRTFRKELIFHLGSDAGFYSEFNNMILAIIYCLQYHILWMRILSIRKDGEIFLCLSVMRSLILFIISII